MRAASVVQVPEDECAACGTYIFLHDILTEVAWWCYRETKFHLTTTMANNRVVSLVLTLAVVTSSASTSSGPYTNASITLSAPPAATYTIPADLLNSSSLNQSAKVTIVNPGGGIKPTLEWTALGDSYATGVGTTNYVDGTRCLRYDEAYPIIININPEYAPGGDAVLPPGLYQFNNVACSGAETKDIIKWQLLDKPTYHEPNPTYGEPLSPQMQTAEH